MTRQITLIKPFSEYVLCNELLAFYDANVDFKANLEWAWHEIEEGDFLTRLLLARPDLFQLACLYASFFRNGYSNKRLEAVLNYINNLRSNSNMEVEPWVRLSVFHAFAQINQIKYNPNSVSGSWLLQMPEPWCINDRVIYSVTHEVFYATDFGRSENLLPQNVNRYLELWLPAWIKYYIHQCNWDITAELSMVADCIGSDVSGIDVFPLILSSQRQDGYIPGPTSVMVPLIDGSESDIEVQFLKNYHTTLVTIIAAALHDYRQND